MITPRGYSKDPSIPPDGIVIAWSEDLINCKGGLDKFTSRFTEHMKSEEFCWLQKCNHQPAKDIAYVYIIVDKVLKYKCYYGGYEEAVVTIDNVYTKSWCSSNTIIWPRLILGGPVEEVPYEIPLKGFIGFRYCTKLF